MIDEKNKRLGTIWGIRDIYAAMDDLIDDGEIPESAELEEEDAWELLKNIYCTDVVNWDTIDFAIKKYFEKGWSNG